MKDLGSLTDFLGLEIKDNNISHSSGHCTDKYKKDPSHSKWPVLILLYPLVSQMGLGAVYIKTM